MSFTFGGATTTSGSTFGTNTPSTGFSFGGGDAAKPLFGSTTTENKPAFNFSSPTTSAPAFPSFSLGAKTATTTTAASSLFASSTTTQSAFGASKPLSFGGFSSPPNQTVGSPGFGQPAQNAAQNLSFGGAQTQAAPAPAPAFGTPPTQAAPAFGSGSFSFGAAAAAAPAAASFSFATPASGFSAQPAAPTASTPQTSAQPSFLSPATSAPASGFGAAPAFGQAAKPAAFSFGSSATPTFGTAATTSAPAPAFGTATPTPAPTFQSPPQPTSLPAPTSLPSFGSPSFGAVSGGLFGAKPAATAAPTATQGTLQTQASQPTLTAQSSFAAPAIPAPSFGTAQPPAASAAKPAPAAASAIGFGGAAVSTPASTGLGFGATSTAAPTGLSFTAQAPTSSISFGTTTAPATSGLPSFGTSTISFGAKTTATTAAPSTVFPLNGKSSKTSFTLPATSSLTTAASTIAPSGITALGKTTTSTTLPSLTTATTTTAAGPPAMVSSISFAQLEENINKWTLELEEQEKTFINQATQINAWDRLLIANGEKIVELNDAVEAVKNEQQSLEHELDFVVAQQKELEDLLAPLENQLQAAAPDAHRDPEREHMYSLAENLDTQLRQMSEDLKEVIEHLNETNRSQDSNDPIVQIGRILNAHMSSMQWVDSSIAQISAKLDGLRRTHLALRRDNERSFHLTYD